MKIYSLLNIHRLALLIFFLLPASLCSGQQYGNMPDTPPPESGSYAVPADKAGQWENMENIARKEYKVCLEHCASVQACMDRCEQAYQRRLESEYHRLAE